MLMKSDSDRLWEAAKRGKEDDLRNILHKCQRIGNLSNCIDTCHKRKGTTALMIACKKTHTTCVDILLENGANRDIIESKGKLNTALHYAVEGNNKEIVEKLLQKDANPYILNGKGYAAIDIARFERKFDIAKVLTVHTHVHSGFLYLRRIQGSLLWKKRWCVATKSNVEGTTIEISVFRKQEEDRPLAIMMVDIGTRVTSPPENKWFDVPHKFLVDAPLVYLDKIKKKHFSRDPSSQYYRIGNQRLQEEIGINVNVSQSFQFAAIDDNTRQQWIDILGSQLATVDDATTNEISVETNEAMELFGSQSFISSSRVSQGDYNASTSSFRHTFTSSSSTMQASCIASAPDFPDDEIETTNLIGLSTETPYQEQAARSMNIVDNPLASSTASSRESDNGTAECILCMDAPRDAICVPCGHLSGCLDCLTRMMETSHQCPICRTPATSIMKIYHC